MSKASQQSHRRLRRRLRAFLAALRPRAWDADQIAAALNGWTVEHRRLGRVVVRDPRFDQLRQARNGELLPDRVIASIGSGRWW
jgi:hypothetical protein